MKLAISRETIAVSFSGTFSIDAVMIPWMEDTR
jgi:hypothetical protein